MEYLNWISDHEFFVLSMSLLASATTIRGWLSRY